MNSILFYKKKKKLMYAHRQGGERERGGREGGLAPSKFELSFSVKNAKD